MQPIRYFFNFLSDFQFLRSRLPANSLPRCFDDNFESPLVWFLLARRLGLSFCIKEHHENFHHTALHIWPSSSVQWAEVMDLNNLTQTAQGFSGEHHCLVLSNSPWGHTCSAGHQGLSEVQCDIHIHAVQLIWQQSDMLLAIVADTRSFIISASCLACAQNLVP